MKTLFKTFQFACFVLAITSVMAQVKKQPQTNKVVVKTSPTKPTLKPEDYKFYLLALASKTRFTKDFEYNGDYKKLLSNTSIFDTRDMKEVKSWYNYQRSHYGKEKVVKQFSNGDIFFIYELGRDNEYFVLVSPNGDIKYKTPSFVSSEYPETTNRGKLTLNDELNKVLYIRNGDVWIANFDVATGKVTGDKQITMIGTFSYSGRPWHWYENTVCIDKLFLNISTGALLDVNQVPLIEELFRNAGNRTFNDALKKYGASRPTSPNKRWIFLSVYHPDYHLPKDATLEKKDGTFFFDCKDFSVKRIGPAFHFTNWDGWQTNPFWIGDEVFLAAPIDYELPYKSRVRVSPNVLAEKYKEVFVVDLQKQMNQTVIGSKQVTYRVNKRDFLINVFTYNGGEQKRLQGDFSWLATTNPQFVNSSPRGQRIILDYSSLITNPAHKQLVNTMPKKVIVFNTKTLTTDSLDFEGDGFSKSSNYTIPGLLYWLDEEHIIFSLDSRIVGVAKQGTYIENLNTKKKTKLVSYMIDTNGLSNIASMEEQKTVFFNANGYLFRCNFDGSGLIKLSEEQNYFRNLMPFLPSN